MANIDERYRGAVVVWDSEDHCFIEHGYRYFAISFHSPVFITTADGTRWNRDGIATEREKKLADENQALRDQVELLEEGTESLKDHVEQLCEVIRDMTK